MKPVSCSEGKDIEKIAWQERPADDAQESTEQRESYLQEQARYWKSFANDLVIGTFKRITISPVVFGAAFFAVAYFIHTFSIKQQDVWSIVKIMEAVMLFPSYIVMGVVCGLIFGVNSTLLKKIQEIEKGVHLIVDPLMANIIQKIPGGQKSISVSEFNSIMDSQIRRFSKASQSQSRLLSIGGFFTRFLMKNILRVFRGTLLSDFLGSLNERGETEITAGALENFAREKVVGIVIDNLRSRFEAIRYALYGWLAIFLAVPIILIILRTY